MAEARDRDMSSFRSGRAQEVIGGREAISSSLPLKLDLVTSLMGRLLELEPAGLLSATTLQQKSIWPISSG